jgi:hypothetical protein
MYHLLNQTIEIFQFLRKVTAYFNILNIPYRAEPTRAITTVVLSILLCSNLREFSNAARAIIAVPCWSSWKTGIEAVYEDNIDLGSIILAIKKNWS